ncbi:hypothetical protein HMN09_01066000 [Mycena chlorophos]|uniref:Uncharacterized protein n=1 Tax=Mycena chlorophos TaxID=658473 RepID=A0A8H6SBN9_MYCCL|nr:hypothetical protein HMN09_01066000 [Mycena chlorophos]
MRWFSLPLALLALKAFVNAEQLTNSKRVDGQISNAERLARGLPLLPPHRRTGPLLPRQSTSPPVPTSRSCNIEAINDVDQSIYGYLSVYYGSTYTYGDFTDSPVLNISLAYSADPSGSQTSFTGLQAQTENSQVQKYYGYLGVVPVETPITASSGYGVLTDVTKYANSPSSNSPSSFAQFLGFGQPAESYVWSLDLTTN